MANDYRASFLSTNDGEMFITETEREHNVRISLTDSIGLVETRYYGFIDLSDTVNFPHSATDRIDLSSIGVTIDKANAGRGSIAVGVITRIDGTDADVTFVTGASFQNNDTSSSEILFNYAPSQLKCLVLAGETPFIKSNSRVLNIAELQSDVLMPYGYSFFPAVGDLIVRTVLTGAGSVNWSVACFYHAHPTVGN